jgi:RNA polymerase sigma-70 factor (ECF subfamily)
MPLASSSRTDIALASRAAAGDHAAFADLYRRHHLSVYRYCRRLLRCPEDAADATQQTFLSMHRRLAAGGAPTESVGGYLMRIAQRASFEVHRGRKAQQAVAERPAAAVTQPDHAPAVVAAQAVRHAAGSLPERQLAVLVMREVHDLSYEEIGARMDMNENAVAQLLHRARKRLARELTHGDLPLAA